MYKHTTIIYKIYSDNGSNIYIGSTNGFLDERWMQHKSSYKCYKKIKKNIVHHINYLMNMD